jgi:predicted transcriptional regulator of viral defense system
MDGDKLMAYAQAYDNIAVIKRMGYLATLFEKKELNAFIAFALSSVQQKYSLFEPGGPDEDMFLNEWKLRMNVSEQDILDIIQSPY